MYVLEEATEMSINGKVAQDKARHPERFCPHPRCLWRTAKLDQLTQKVTGGGYCPRHMPPSIERQTITFLRNHADVMRMTGEWAGAGILYSAVRHLEQELA